MASTEPIWVELARFAGQAIVVGIGWYVVHRFSIARDRDKARREMVVKNADALCEKVTALFDLSLTYHANDRDRTAERKLKSGLQDIATHIQSLSEIVPDNQTFQNCRKALIGLRRSISGRHFEDEHLHPLPEDADQYQAIAAAASEMKQRLYALKHAQFPVDPSTPL